MNTPRPRKRFGQNFLRDHSVIDRILSEINPREADHIVEIGPGKGALTEPLLSRCARLDVIEVDRDLAALLRQRFAGAMNLNVLCEDALKFDFRSLADSNRKLRVVGNLPYNISTPLLFHLLSQLPSIKDMHFMLQKEVVDRICAAPGGRVFGKLSIMVQFHLEAEKLFDVEPESFHPVPKVSSSILRLTPWPSPRYSPQSLEAFKTLVTQAFSQRRKTLKNALKGCLSADEIASAGVDPESRAETLDISAYTRMSDLYCRKS